MNPTPFNCVKCNDTIVDLIDNIEEQIVNTFWEINVVCVPHKFVVRNPEHVHADTLQYIFEQTENKPLMGTYTGYGCVIVHTSDRQGNLFIITPYDNEKYVMDDNYILARFWCNTCFKW